MKSIVLNLSLWLSAVGYAGNLEVIPVGSFGGSRLWVECAFGASAGRCMLDTAGALSVIPNNSFTNRYSVIGRSKLSGMGSLSFVCDLVQPDDFSFGSEPIKKPTFCRSDEFPVQNTPMVGINLLDSKVFELDFTKRVFRFSSTNTAHLPLQRNSIGWMVIPVSFESMPLVAAIDTGSPLTIFDNQMVSKFPDQFELVASPPGSKDAEMGIRRFKIKSAIVINGLAIEADYVYVGDLAKFSDANEQHQPQALLGMNHLQQLNWIFDLNKNLWSASNR